MSSSASTFTNTCCSCDTLTNTSYCLKTSFVWKSVSSPLQTGMRSSQSNIWPQVQLLGRDAGIMLNKHRSPSNFMNNISILGTWKQYLWKEGPSLSLKREEGFIATIAIQTNTEKIQYLQLSSRLSAGSKRMMACCWNHCLLLRPAALVGELGLQQQ